MKYNIEVNGTKIVSIIGYFDNTIDKSDKYKVIETNLSHIEIISNYSWVDNKLLLTGPAPSGTYMYDPDTETWVDTRTLQELKDIKRQEIKSSRSSAESAGFTHDNAIFDSDNFSQSRIAGAVQLALLAQMTNQPFEVTWTLKDGTFKVLNTADMISVGIALGTHVQIQFNKGRQLQTQIEAATTKEELDLITWS